MTIYVTSPIYMLSKLLISADIASRREKIGEIIGDFGLKNPHPDLLYIEEGQKLGVKEAKEILDFLSFKPYSAKGRGVVLENAASLTIDAQNTLLKILEEPPIEALIILGVSSDRELLATVISRCQVENLESKAVSQELEFAGEIGRLEEMSIEERFEVIEKIEEKDEFLEELVSFYQQKLQKDPKYLEFAKKLLEAQKWQRSNGNLRAILEYLMLNL